MRIVVWNAAMAVHRKLPLLLDAYHPDVVVIPECAREAVLERKSARTLYGSMVWVGRNPNKGLAAFAFGPYKVESAPGRQPSLEWISPIRVTGPISFNLLAVWALNQTASNARDDPSAALQPWAALDLYRDWVAAAPTVFAGDFNHNVRWDRPRGQRNHSMTVTRAEAAGLTSAYHHWFGQAQGAESRPTIYWRNRTETGLRYHLDYAFVPRAWLSSLTSVALGTYEQWVATGLSDHVPLVLDFAKSITW